MIIGRILGGAQLAIMETAEETALWVASVPLANDIVFDNSQGLLVYYDFDTQAALPVNAPLSVLDWEAYTVAGMTGFTDAGLANKKILMLSREGNVKSVVKNTPAAPNQIQYNAATGEFTLFAGDVFGYEHILILYSNLPTIFV